MVESSLHELDGDDARRIGISSVRLKLFRKLGPLILSSVAMLSLFLLGLIAVTQFGVARLNQYAVDRSERILESGLAFVEEDLTTQTGDYAFWNDAVLNLATRFDGEWADENVGIWAFENLSISASLVLDANNHPVYAMQEGRRIDAPDKMLAPELVALANRVRQLPDEPPYAEHIYFTDHGHTYLVAASALLDEETTLESVPKEGVCVLLFFREIDAPFLKSLGERFLLTDLALSYDIPEEDTAHLLLRSPSGEFEAALTWEASTPGYLFLKDTVPYAAILLVATLLFLHFIVRRGYHYVREIRDLDEALNRRNEDLESHKGQLTRALVAATHANQAKADFLAYMSHELRTPLNAILGFSEIMRTEQFGQLGNPKYQEYSNDINDSGRHLLSLIEDILDLSKADAGKLDLRRESIDGVALVQRCMTLLSARAERQGVQMQLEAPDRRVTFYADELRLKQIVINLLSNAIKASERGRKIKARVRAEAGGLAVLEVIDQGCGISKDDLTRVVEPFERVRPLLASQAEGTGLGLPIVRRLAEAQGGDFTLLSKIGRGTVARVRLPSSGPSRRMVPVPGGDEGTDLVEVA